MSKYLVVALGGALGAIARYLLSEYIGKLSISPFPYATFLINISGSFVIGVFLTLIARGAPINDHWRLVFAVGFLGAYTTFSSFEYETLKLIEEGKFGYSLLYVLSSLIVGFIGVWLGAALARWFY